jgi:hypothetical protein
MLEISVATYRRRFIDSFGILFASSGKMEARMAEFAATWVWWGRQCKGLRRHKATQLPAAATSLPAAKLAMPFLRPICGRVG